MAEIIEQFKAVIDWDRGLGYAELNELLGDESRFSSEASLGQGQTPPRV